MNELPVIEVPVIDAKWHKKRVAEYRSWIKNTRKSIARWEQMLANDRAHLEQEMKWLEEAIRDQKEFEAREAQS